MPLCSGNFSITAAYYAPIMPGVIFYNERPFEEILKEVASLPPHSAIFFQQLAVDGAGVVYGDKEPLKRISEVANAPIFSYDQIHFTGEVLVADVFTGRGCPTNKTSSCPIVGDQWRGGSDFRCWHLISLR
jgi:hypothetical protein